MSKPTREHTLTRVLNTGFEKAADSFSRFINRNIRITDSKSSMMQHNHKDEACISEEKGRLYVLITRVIGDVTGKSFLICSEDECREIFGTLNTADDKLNEAFLLEIDNIVSAMVISELSRSLGIEVFGDVPQLTKIDAKDLNPFILGEVVRDESRSVITNTTFQFDHKKIHPQFIWKFNSKILDMIPEHSN